MWRSIQPAPKDAILGLTEAFRHDPRPTKVNLGVGVYKDEAGHTPILTSVKAAEKKIIETQKTKSYMPIEGAPAYAKEVQKMILGACFERAASTHTPGGTGALRLAAELLRKFDKKTIWMSNPTWANHTNIFNAAGLTVKEYPYYNAETKALDSEGFFNALKKIPASDCVLLHACCHNPTGVDLSVEQWQKVAKSAEKNGWIPLIDFAYQGFGESIETDRVGIKTLMAVPVDFFIANSFSKNVGLYRERTGALTIVAATPIDAETAMSHMKAVARVLYSNPPAHGGMIVTTILQDDVLRPQWKKELKSMRDRIAQMRMALTEKLIKRDVPMDSSFITQQNGMFSFSGLNREQVNFLREEKAIYIVGSGRINVAGLTSENLDFVCDAIAETLKHFNCRI